MGRANRQKSGKAGRDDEGRKIENFIMTGTIHIGPAGWSYKDWEGIVYPGKKWRGFDPLAYLAEYFDTIEINSTFYAPPRTATTRAWARRVGHNKDFQFTLKLWKIFTHEAGKGSQKEAAYFRRVIDPLLTDKKLGALLIQFPWSFKYGSDSREQIRRLAGFFRDCPLVLEVRHASWNREEVFAFLTELGIGFCNIDQPLFSCSLGPTARTSAPLGYVRLHGRNYADWFRADAGRDARYNHLYSQKELAPWVEKIKQIDRQALATYVITNNHFRGKAVCNALELKYQMKGEKVKVPPPMLKAFDRLDKISEPQQDSLFP